MNFDFAELLLRIESRFGLRLRAADLAAVAAGRQPQDIRAADLLEAVRTGRCRACGEDLCGRPLSGTCPGCGTAYDQSDEASWRQMREILAEVSGAPAEQITPQTLLIRELGLT